MMVISIDTCLRARRTHALELELSQHDGIKTRWCSSDESRDLASCQRSKEFTLHDDEHQPQCWMYDMCLPLHPYQLNVEEYSLCPVCTLVIHPLKDLRMSLPHQISRAVPGGVRRTVLALDVPLTMVFRY